MEISESLLEAPVIGLWPEPIEVPKNVLQTGSMWPCFNIRGVKVMVKKPGFGGDRAFTNETTAYSLARALGIKMPETCSKLLIVGKPSASALRYYASDYPKMFLVTRWWGGVGHFEERGSYKQQREIQVFNALIRAGDRHHRNALVAGDMMYPIDHEIAFHDSSGSRFFEYEGRVKSQLSTGDLELVEQARVWALDEPDSPQVRLVIENAERLDRKSTRL